MSYARERDILKEFLKLYAQHPCLWDKNTVIYKDKKQKTRAWNVLVDKLTELDPDVNIQTAKKKIEHMRTAYFRELKKVTQNTSETSEVYIPSLWYFNLLHSILSKTSDHRCSSEEDPLANDEVEQNTIEVDPHSDDESHQSERVRPRKINKAMRCNQTDRFLDRKKLKYVDTAQEQVQGTKPQESIRHDSFAVYVGEQLQQVDKFQRHVAEKLISEVIFLAKTGNLGFDTKIETPSGSRAHFSRNNSVSQPPSPQINQPSPTHASSLLQIVQLSDPKSTEENDTSCNSAYYEDTGTGTDKSMLKELLIVKKPK